MGAQNRRRARPAAVAVAALALLPGAGRAQTEPPDSGVLLIDTLTVDVLRLPVTLDDTPFAVSAVGKEQLRAGKAGVSLEEALQAVPGVQIQNRYNYSTGERVAVRGLGARAQFGVRGLKILIDRIPATLPDGQATMEHLDLGSLGRVEALRGAAAALYGNASGGVLSFTTEPPAAVPFRPEVLALVGGDGLGRFQASASGTAGGTGYGIDVGYMGYDGFRTNPTGSGDAFYSRAERLNVNGQLSWQAWGGDLGLTVNVLDLGAENPGSLPDSLAFDDARPAWAFNVVQGSRKDVTQGQAGLSWTGPLGTLQGEFTAYGVLRSLDNPIPNAIIDLGRTAGGIRAVLGSDTRLHERSGWLVGADVELQRDDRLNYENDGGEPGAVTLDQLETVVGAGVFAQGSVRLGDAAHLVAGLRYDRTGFEAQDRMPERFPDQDLEDASGDRTMDAFSPSLGVSVAVAPGHALFASASSLFGTPTTTELANQPDGSRGFNQELEPQTGYALELGARGEIGPAAGYDVAVFLTRLQDELIPFEVPDQPGRSFFKNAGESRYAGIEASLFGRLEAGLQGRLTYSYTDAEFTDYVVDGDDLAGNAIPGQAPHRLEAVVRGDWRRAFVEARGLYMDAIPADDANSAAAEAYGLLDLRAGIEELALGRLVATPFVGVNNVLDEAYVASVVVNAFGGRFFEPGPARTAYVGLSVAWPGA